MSVKFNLNLPEIPHIPKAQYGVVMRCVVATRVFTVTVRWVRSWIAASTLLMIGTALFPFLTLTAKKNHNK